MLSWWSRSKTMRWIRPTLELLLWGAVVFALGWGLCFLGYVLDGR